MTVRVTDSNKSWIESLTPEQTAKLHASLTEEEAHHLTYDWRRWARPNQIIPAGDWYVWLILAGRGWGKSRTGAEAVREEVEAGRAGRIALVAETAADARDVMVEGESGILAISPPWNRPKYEPSKRRLTWDNGAIATHYDAREPDQLRGPQHDFFWGDEWAKFRYAQACWDNLLPGLRLGVHPRGVITTTPRPTPMIKALVKDSGVLVTKGRSTDNLGNLAATFKRTVIDRYAGTRLGRQELDAEILEDVPGALWSRRTIEESRLEKAPPMKRIVVGVDPAATGGENSNENGIIICGVDAQNKGYVLDDWSERGSPDKWARKVVGAFRRYEADRVIVEVNQGGDMVASVLRSVDASLPIEEVRASRGKYVRAEPVAALYEQGRVHHVGAFTELEDQMATFTPERAADRSDGYSPDRVDALVWALSALFPTMIEKVERKAYVPPPPPFGGNSWMGR